MEPPANSLPAPSTESTTETLVESKQPDLRAALTPSLAYLERDGRAWMRGESPLNQDNGCISCHVVGFALWSHSAAARHGLSVNTVEIEQLTEQATEFIARPGIGRAVTWSQLLLGRSSSSGAIEADWDGMVDGLLASQEAAGQWRARGQFPTQLRSESESDAVATMWALLALDSMGDLGDRDADARLRALSWLRQSVGGVSSEWLAMRLLIAVRFGDESAAADLLERLIASQRADGGWGWLLESEGQESTEQSNAYSTGVALYSLRRGGLPGARPVVEAARDYLLETRRDDGIWEVASRLTSAEPSAAKDYVYEYWGTAWAVIGLSEMLGGGKFD